MAGSSGMDVSRGRSSALLLGAVVAGAVLRLLVLACSTGTNDIHTWERFARLVDSAGWRAAYNLDPGLNHPLFGLGYAWLVHRSTALLDLSFPFVFRLGSLVADVITIALAALVARHLSQAREARTAWLYALSLPAVLVSSYHGNTDAIVLCVLMLALWLVEVRHRPVAGGLVLALAINIKIFPVLLLPILAATFPDRRSAVRFLVASAAAVLPIGAGIVGAGAPFVSNVLGYRPILETWGINFLLWDRELAGAHRYADAAAILLPALAVVLGLAQLRARWWRTHTEAATVILLLMVIFAPGFGLQYLIWVAPLIVLVVPHLALWYSLAAGVFGGLGYYSFMISRWPFASDHTPSTFPAGVALAGGCVWIVLILCLMAVCRKRSASAPV